MRAGLTRGDSFQYLTLNLEKGEEEKTRLLHRIGSERNSPIAYVVKLRLVNEEAFRGLRLVRGLYAGSG